MATNYRAFQQWSPKNSMVTAWLIQTMMPTISKTCLFLPTTKDIWQAIHRTYFNGEDSSQTFDIKTILWNLK